MISPLQFLREKAIKSRAARLLLDSDISVVAAELMNEYADAVLAERAGVRSHMANNANTVPPKDSGATRDNAG